MVRNNPPPTQVIDLKNYAPDWMRDLDRYIFFAREEGERIRAETGLDELDKQTDLTVEIRIPENTDNISLKFWLEFFGPSILAIAAQVKGKRRNRQVHRKFHRRFRFDGDPYWVEQLTAKRGVIDEAIDQWLIPLPIHAC